MKIKTWVIGGIVYLVMVVAGYSVVTGENPLNSGEMNHGDHEGQQEEQDHGEHSNDEVDHSEHGSSSESQVQTDVTYKEGRLIVSLEDDEGNVPQLEENHEKLMHLIVVSTNLEDYVHLHPEIDENNMYLSEVTLEPGYYKAFVDISPKDKKYRVEENELSVGDLEENEAHLTPTSYTQDVAEKKVTLEASGLSTDETSVLSFDLHGEIPLPYLGALGHVVILNESADEFIHVHPTSETETTFETHFDTPGMYKVWAEFNFEDEGVVVFPYVIEVN
ncbi:hypothetical protein [Alteribacillus sp. HJP-4]|uniref:hypothetical protein n=1 Tax=Alteribacillus sp. HJP-4 TaxID=2775394 RepID=UPI0035CCDD83